MNQILVTEKLYVTPEVKKKKMIYKLEFFLSVFLVCLLCSYYIYAEYDRTKSEQVSKDILAQIKYETDTTVKQTENDAIIVFFSNEQEQLQQNIAQEQDTEQQPNEIIDNTPDNTTTGNSAEYEADDGKNYITESVLKIPVINIEYPVLSETTPELLFVSLNKYWGPQPNEVGNYCIVGHYYESGKMFGKLHKLKNGDKAELTDLSGRTVTYQVYNKFIVEPTDTRCTSQLTNGKKELTLITCTNHGKQRLVVKLREV